MIYHNYGKIFLKGTISQRDDLWKFVVRFYVYVVQLMQN